ncbi:MAG TPA: response regulator, partial [Candidatus Dormibacteraeota bacterium]|nr:response regulator [Candidatus Dormibacteraeota bacterium]
MADDLESGPAFVELMKQSQSALAGLQALEEHLSTKLADQHAQLKATRTELEQAREATADLRGAHERLTAEHARTLDEIAHHRNARAGLEATVLEMRRELAQALGERDELNGAWDRERRELEDRLALQEAALADRLNRISSLEAQVDELAAAQVSWQAERDTLTESRDQLGGRLRDLEAGQRQAQDDLARAIHNREQLRTVFEELKETHATAGERSAAAFRELARLQDELARAKASSDELQTHQLTWAADRETLLAAAQTAEQRRIALEAELAKAQLALTELTALSEGDLAKLRQEAASLKMQLSDERARLEASLAAANDQLRLASQAAATADKARGEGQAQIARLVERAQAAAQEWGVRRESMTEENLRLSEAVAQARQAQRSAEDTQRQMQGRLQQVEQASREKLAMLEARLRSAEDAASRPLTQEEAHRINTRLNAIMGFANILLDPGTNAIGAREQTEFIRLIDESSRALGEDLRLVPVAGAAASAQPSDKADSEKATAGPSVASLKGDPPPPAVLVADPDPAVRDAIAPFLSRAGYTVAYASTRQEAVEQASALSPVVILADATLQLGGVAALIADLQRDPRTADIPVVVTTPNAAQPLGVELGQVDVLSKPIDRQQLLQMMINQDLQADARRAQKLPARVLVIDDDPLSLRLLTAVLKPLKIEVTTAGGGKAGLELAKQTDPQLIICDLTMPDLDGFGVIAALRADPQTSAVPILVYTGKTITPEDQQRLQGLIPS